MDDALRREADRVLEAARREDWLTVKEFAAARRVHEETVKRWCRQGLVPCERIGRRGHWRIRRTQEAA